MQIHELNNFTGTLGSGAYLAIDDGTDTGKISSQGLLAATEARIDNIIAGPAPSAQEVTDARLGADGVVYPSLGDAIRDQVTDLKADLNETATDLKSALNKKADEIGTTSFAQDLYPTATDEESTPYIFRASKNVGDSKYGTIIGGSIPFKQAVKNGDFSDGTSTWYVYNGSYSSISAQNGVLTQSIGGGQTVAAYMYGVYTPFDEPLTSGHKYLVSAVVSSSVPTNFMIELGSGNEYVTPTISAKTKVESIVSFANNMPSVTFYPMSAFNMVVAPTAVITYENVQVIDITQEMGASIADHIYNLEQTTSGSGISLFRSIFSANYYPFADGELDHVRGLSQHIVTGFNQLDENDVETDKGLNVDGDVISINGRSVSGWVKVLPNTEYYISYVLPATDGVGIMAYDANQRKITAIAPEGAVTATKGIFTTPSNASYIRASIGTTEDVNWCINRSRNGLRNGEYEPYRKYSYPLDPTITLRGKFKLNEDGTISFDGDEYKADRTITRNYGIVNLGSLDWYYISASDWNCFTVGIPDKAIGFDNIVCDKYVLGDMYGTNTNNIICGNVNSKDIYIRDTDYTSASDFKTAVNNLYLVYELESQFVESGNPYTHLQTANEWGTEEYVTASAVPVGHITKYYYSLKNKLEHLPPSTSIYQYGGIRGVMAQSMWGTYIGDTIVVDSTIDITNNDTYDQFKTIANCQITLNADMFDWSNVYRPLPTFVNCIFYGNGHSIVASGRYISSAKFINCYFFNCGLTQEATYIQSSRFIGCRFIGNVDVMSGANCGDISFNECQGESDFNARLVNITATANENAVDHLRLTNCVFEGNSETELIRFNKNATIDICGCYFEMNSYGVMKAVSGDNSSTLLLNVSGVKTWNSGNPMFYIDSSYSGENVAVAFKACRLTAFSETDLLNRYDLPQYSVELCILDKVIAN